MVHTNLITPSPTGDPFSMLAKHWNFSNEHKFHVYNNIPYKSTVIMLTKTFVSCNCRVVNFLC